MWYKISPDEIINLDFCLGIEQNNYYRSEQGIVPSIDFTLTDDNVAHKVFEDKEEAEDEFERLKDFFLRRNFTNEF